MKKKTTGRNLKNSAFSFFMLFRNIHVFLYCLISSVSGLPPYFVNPPRDTADVTIVENILVGSPIYIVMVNDPDPGDTLSTIIMGTVDFSLSDTGTPGELILSTNRLFNYSLPEDRSHQVSIFVSDGTLSKVVNLTIYVIPANKNIATINGNFTTAISEEVPVGTVVKFKNLNITKANAEDVQMYSLSGENAANFYINNLTGEIRVAKRIDRDHGLHKTTDLKLTVSNQTGYTATGSLTVVFQDINDNAPVCNPSVYYVNIQENEDSGKHVKTVKCTDMDSALNKALNMTISPTNGNDKYFSINPSGEIKTTNVSLDYEKLANSSFQLEIIVLVNDMPTSNPQKTGTATIIVSVLPVNECGPEWDQFIPPLPSMKQYTLQENSPVGTVVVTVKAIDCDLGSDGEITYEMNATGSVAAFFRMDAVTGELTVKSLIDADPNTGGTELFYLAVIAKDGGGKSSSPVVLYVMMDDENDNEPHFSSSVYTASIEEQAVVGTDVIFINATDDDLFATLSFSVVSGDPMGKFRFSPNNDSLLQLNAPIYPDKPIKDPELYHLKVQVKDGGSIERTAETEVIIHVQLVNDHAPVFSAPVSGQVTEDANIGTSVVTVTAKDDDWGDDKNIVYRIAAGNTDQAFSINKEGIIQVANALDFENVSTYKLIIVASDEGTPALSSTMMQQINITNINDQPVVCGNSKHHIKILENASLNTELAILNCHDKDNLTSVTYNINGAGLGIFRIDNVGRLTLIAALDYDVGPNSYFFDICVSDGKYTTTILVTVTLMPVNEFPPDFQDMLITTKLKEDAAIYSLVASVRVTDNDAPPHHVTRLWLQNALSPAMFGLEEDTGNIRLIQKLDYETKQSYSLLVTAVDGGNLKATSTVSVLVEDVNDNSPVCVKSILHVTLNEDAANETLVSSLNCKDADTGTFGTLTYSLTQTPTGENFKVNAVGEVRLKGKCLDYETTKYYHVNVIVEDGGFKQTNVLIVIDVIDINDGPPRFLNSPKMVTVSEDAPVMSLVTNMVASDPDDKTGPYGQLIYEIIFGNNEQLFTINRNSGQITLAGNLDREKTEMYVLAIKATESVTYNAASATASLTVSVLDVNDNPPNCPFLSFNREVKETTTLNNQIITLSCTDPDTPAVGGTLAYSITIGDQSVFELINNTLILKAPLDFDQGRRRYSLTLTVTDSLFKVDIQGSVAVTSVDQYHPVFKPDQYLKRIPENSHVGQIILTVNAFDKDSSDTSDGVVTYSLPNSGILPFSIDGTTGKISLVSPLDWEIKKSYSFQVTASDKSHLTSAKVNITVVDVNDNRPVFVKGSYSQKIPETSPIGTTVIQVSAADADGPSNGNITYSISDGNSGCEFDIIRDTGHIRTLKMLDYDTISVNSFTLRVVAADQNGAPGSLSGTTLVTFLVSSANEYPPLFSQINYLVSAKESEPVGFQILQVSASDKDKGPDGEVYYSFTSVSSGNFFSLDSSTGQLFLRSPLDFETCKRHELNITATDLGSTPKSDRATVIVTVQNVNDEIPECLMSFMPKDVREDFPVQNKILHLSCSDKDAGLFGKLNFFIENVNGLTGQGQFKIDNSGQLSLTSSLDYEINKVLLLKISVSDGGKPPQSTKVLVKITVIDVNEAKPVFNNFQNSIQVLESVPIGHLVVTVSARDNDTNDVLTYSFTSPSNEFEIDPLYGNIKVKSSLDFEIKQSYTLDITVADSGTVPQSYSAKTTLVVTLIDVNDSPPVFSSSVYQVNVMENQPGGTPVATLTVTDADSGPNAQATFQIVNGDTTNTFLVAIDGAGNCDVSLTTPSLLDYEQKSQYTLIIRATDSGRLSAETTLAIQVQPYNEYQPSFQNISPNLTIKENVRIGTTLTKITATDKDVGQDGKIFYQLSGGFGKFIIDHQSGAIIIHGQLDREKVTSYQLLVIAKDCGVTPSALSSTLTLTITVEDINDNNPTCAGRQQNNAFVSENKPIGTSVYQLVCTDRDRDPASKNNVLHYTITKGNTDSGFAINDTSGLLSTKKAMDREVKGLYELTIEVSDHGSPSRSVDQIVYVQITDVNDNTPVFTLNNYTVSVSENLPIASVVLKVIATDRDERDAGAVWYSILSGNANKQFALDFLTGDLKLINNLDREAVNFYSICIQAIDGGSPPLSAKALVMVSVNDENDNSPSCSFSYYSATLTENAKPSTPVISLQCTDLDVGPNAILSYFIVSGNTDNSFYINQTTGSITVFRSLDAEQKMKYLLNIDVTDNVYTTKVEVEIILLDINETPPKFTPPGPFETHVLENTAIGSSVFKVIARDDDASSTTIFFSFSAPNKYFRINKLTGVVSISDHLDRETTSKYNLYIKITDNGSPHPLSDSTVLTIIVDDVNDNNPSCNKTHYVVSLSEDISPSKWLTNISCFDVDTSTPMVKYTIESGDNSGLFEVISDSGQIFLKKSLDFETAILHTLDIRVADYGTTLTLSTSVKFIVKVLPINEHAPIFGRMKSNIITVMENSSLGSLITLVNATDNDKGEDHGQIAFGIVSGDSSGHFLIDSKTGKISLVKQLDRESQDQYTLTVIAKDGIHGVAAKQLTASISIHINVADVNDNYPEFDQISSVVSVSEKVRIGTKLLTLDVHDDDLGINGEVFFVIVYGDATNRFMINHTDLIVKDKLDFRKTRYYLLKIQAHDKGVPPLSSYAYVTVNLEPRNDIPPKFSSSNASIVLKENHTIGSIVYRVNVTNRISGNSDELNISISSVIPSNAPRHAFLIDDQRGDIILAAPLDYDRIPNKFALIISVINDGFPFTNLLSSTMTLYITIENINDNAPVFEKNTYSFFVNENEPPNTLIGRVKAVDNDFPPFGDITYLIVGSETNNEDFELNQKDGAFYVNRSVDFERKSVYVYTVEAVDKSNPVKSGRCIVHISVQDVNDIAPKFSPSRRSLDIPEDSAVDTSVIKMKAIDFDSTANGNSDIQFNLIEITSGTSYFRIDAVSGIIYVHRRLDREIISKHDLIVYATDSGTPPLTGSTNITVYVKDINDNSPNFIGRYQNTISEETHKGTVVFQFSAYDRDTGINGAVTFNILSGNTNEDFWLDPTSGYLLINKSLDRERTASYRMQVKVSDRGSPMRWSSTDAIIFIKDENDNKPRFLSSNYTFTVAENLPALTRVGQLVADDADIGRNALLMYRILFMLKGPNDFNIDGGTGVIKSRFKLDRESVSVYQLWCKVTDNGEPSLTAHTAVNIFVIDQNDHIPTFRHDSFSASISEQDSVGTTVLFFNITDEDTGNFGFITLSILPNVGDAILASRYFNVLSANQSLVLKHQVDRELVSSFHFTMLAQDGGIPRLSSKATVDILVGDFNDHDPVFTKTFHNLEIAYDGSCKSFLTQVKAIDRDKEDNSRIAYYFVQSKYNYLFAINDMTGDIRIQMEAQKNWIYILTIHAHDYGMPQRKSINNATLRIDTFDPTDIAVSIHLEIKREDFNVEQITFKQQLNALLRVKYPHGRFKIWCIQERDGVARSSPQAMRRLTANNNPVTVNVYCIKSNMTSDEANVKTRKDFCSRQEILSFLTVQANGEISGALKGPAWDYFAIKNVKGYGSTNEVNWASTTNGIVILVLGCLLVLFVNGISLGYCYLRKKRNSSVDPKTPIIEQKIELQDDDLKKKIFRPNVITTLNKDNPLNIKQPLLNKLKEKSFDGRAIDPVSGHLYEYNTLTNERRWVPTPVENTPKLTPRNNLL